MINMIRILIIILTFRTVFSTTNRSYCSIVCPNGKTGGHTMCKYKEGPSKTCQEYQRYTFSQENIKDILMEHNDVRADFDRLSEYDEHQKLVPYRWDTELSEIAQRLADQCFESSYLNTLQECRNLGNSDTPDSTVLQNTIRITGKVYWTTLVSMEMLMKNFLEKDASIEKITSNTANAMGCGASSFRSRLDSSVYMQLVICNYGHKEEEKPEKKSVEKSVEKSEEKSQDIILDINNTRRSFGEADWGNATGNGEYKTITLNIYNRIAKSERAPVEESDDLRRSFLSKRVLQWNRRSGYASLTSVRPVYGKWQNGDCLCVENATPDLQAEQELYEKIEGARENGIDFFYSDGDACICAVEGTSDSVSDNANAVSYFKNAYRIFWTWILYYYIYDYIM